MTRSAGVFVQNNFVRGLITDTTALNSSENSVFDTDNCVFQETGKVVRRKGLIKESPLFNVTRSFDHVVTEYLWEGAAGQGDLTFVVVQYGALLRFYNVTSESLSAGLEVFSVSLTGIVVSGGWVDPTVPAGFAAGNGLLFVTHPNCTPFYVSYDITTRTFSTNTISIKIRDFEGLPDDASFGFFRPLASAVTNNHIYNIMNQGWYDDALVSTPTGLALMDVLDYWKTYRGDYPSIADIWWLMKNSDEAMELAYADSTAIGNTPAPKGHYILDLFYQDRSSASGISGLPVVSSNQRRPSVVAFFAGRAFYSGVQAQGYSFKIYFSQIIQSNGDLGKCYQTNDPTAENLSDLLPTDGGVISIPDMGVVYKMVPLNTDLLVFASNGIWSISGNTGIGFVATDYSVRKISTVASLSPSSFIFVNGSMFFWNYDGIYKVGPDPQTGAIVVDSVSDNTIKKFFQAIPSSSKSSVKAGFDPITKIIQWLYKSDSSYTYYDKMLNLNTITGAFYPWSLPSSVDKPRIVGLISIKGDGLSIEEGLVQDSAGNTVTYSGGNVTVLSQFKILINGGFRYLFSEPNGDTAFCTMTSTSYKDFTDIDYSSYFVTGFSIHGDGLRKFQSNYVTVFSDVESNSSVYIRGRRSFGLNQNSNKFSTPQQGYRHNSNFLVTSRKLKILGTGLSLQLEFTSETGKPFNILGVSVFETVSGVP